MKVKSESEVTQSCPTLSDLMDPVSFVAGTVSGMIPVQFVSNSGPREGDGTHSSTLAWKIPWTEEPGGCSPWGH